MLWSSPFGTSLSLSGVMVLSKLTLDFKDHIIYDSTLSYGVIARSCSQPGSSHGVPHTHYRSDLASFRISESRAMTGICGNGSRC